MPLFAHRSRLAWLAAPMLLACSNAETIAPTGECLPPNRFVADRCLEPGIADDGCPAGTLGQPDGSCRLAGILPDECAEGFAHDGDVGCEPILPPEPCLKGLMAVPGDTVCRPAMPCAQGKWGDIPVDASTVYVDAAYAGGMSDGTSARPWPTIAQGVAAATNGALIAVAEGTYNEDVSISGKAVHLWGVCPEKVQLSGTGGGLAILDIRYASASGTELHGVAITGAAIGVFVSGAERVVLDRLWLHDTAWRGVNVQSSLGVTSVSVTGSLIELSRDQGLYVGGSDATVDATVVRETLPRPADQLFGRGLTAEVLCTSANICDPTAPSRATVRGSLIEQNHEIGLYVAGSDATVEATVVRDTLPRASDQGGGRGINVEACGSDTCGSVASATAHVRGSVIEQNRDYGLYLSGDGSIEATVVRGTLPRASDGSFGRGIGIEACGPDTGCSSLTPATATVHGSLVDDNHDMGVLVMASEATVEATVVRGTLPRASDGLSGFGIDIQLYCAPTPLGCDSAARATGTVRGSVVEQNSEVGVFVMGADATVEGTLVRGTLPRADNRTGYGVCFQVACVANGCDPLARALGSVQGSLLEDNHELGLAITGSDATVEATLVRHSLHADNGLLGDGIAVIYASTPASSTLTHTRVQDSARAGISNFGALVSLGNTAIQCAAFELEGQDFQGSSFRFEDRGANACGCPAAEGACKSVGIVLEPPEPLPAR